MGRTLPTATGNFMIEKEEWKPFRNALDKKDRPLFDQMFSTSRLHTMSMAAAMPSHPVRIQLIMMSIVLEHQKQLDAMTKQLQAFQDI